MTPDTLRRILSRVATGEISAEDAERELSRLPFHDVGVARVDTHRALRQGMPEVIFGERKTADDILTIMRSLVEAGHNALVTRISPEAAASIRKTFPESRHVSECRIVSYTPHPVSHTGKGPILIVTAGTSDRPVAEEAAVTAEFLGNPVERLSDVGVAGIHRLMAAQDQLRAARVLIVVAGMEGALASVVGGMVRAPVIAVPTSVGYGASFGGLAALLAMMNSCAAGVTVVNIDNGFGAACAAHLMNQL